MDDPLTYGPKENEMQKKAYSMGGVEFRHAFFRALQTSRDFVRARHPNCDRSQRHVSLRCFFITKYPNARISFIEQSSFYRLL